MNHSNANTTTIRGDDLLNQLECGSLPPERFHHADHLHAAWLYLTRFSATEAIGKFSQALRNYTARLGKPERYHETITWAFLLLVNERIQRSNVKATWEEFVAQNQDLFDWKNSILFRYYRPETLNSDLARRIFVMPERF